MQLKPLTNSLKPLTLAAIISNIPSFVYSDIDSFSGITYASNSITAAYINEVDKTDTAVWSQKFAFDFYLEKWKQSALFLSSTKDIIENENFKAIVAMGKGAVPYIISEIDTKPSSLVWALNFIFEKKITDKPDATISEACKLWVKALKK